MLQKRLLVLPPRQCAVLRTPVGGHLRTRRSHLMMYGRDSLLDLHSHANTRSCLYYCQLGSLTSMYLTPACNWAVKLVNWHLAIVL